MYLFSQTFVYFFIFISALQCSCRPVPSYSKTEITSSQTEVPNDNDEILADIITTQEKISNSENFPNNITDLNQSQAELNRVEREIWVTTSSQTEVPSYTSEETFADIISTEQKIANSENFSNNISDLDHKSQAELNREEVEIWKSSSQCETTSSQTETSSEITVGEELKQEMKDFNPLLEQVADVKVRYKLEGKLEELIKRGIRAEHQNKIFLKREGKLETEKNIKTEELNAFVFPLTVGFYAVKIESRCRDVKFAVPTALTRSLKAQKKNSVERTYKWLAILKDCKTDMYVACVVSEIKDHFRKKHHIHNNIDAENDRQWEEKYNKFLYNFADAVVQAIEMRNNLAHHDFTRGRVDSLKKFVEPIDEYLTIFYNSLLGYITNDPPIVEQDKEHQE